MRRNGNRALISWEWISIEHTGEHDMIMLWLRREVCSGCSDDSNPIILSRSNLLPLQEQLLGLGITPVIEHDELRPFMQKRTLLSQWHLFRHSMLMDIFVAALVTFIIYLSITGRFPWHDL